jgi:hypothetical protein
MKSHILLFIALSILLISPTISFFAEAQAQADCVAYSGNSIPDSQIDGVIGPEWNDAGLVSQFAIDPQGLAQVWTKQDGTYLYVAIRFYADSQNPWVAIQFGQDICMSSSADGAMFGDDNYAANGYRDIYFLQSGQVGVDATQNGVGAINVNASNAVVVELKKPLNSGDTAGKDINWTQACSYPMVIMWDSDGGGSSGGSVNHAVGTHTARTLLVNSETNIVPEFPTSIVLVIAAAALVFVAILTKKQSNKLHRNIPIV